MELCGCKLDGWMDALLTITVFFLSSVIWNEWKVVVVEVRVEVEVAGTGSGRSCSGSSTGSSGSSTDGRRG